MRDIMAVSGHEHVAVLAFPFGTHAAPLLNLVCRLAAEAPNLKFSFLTTAKSNEKLRSKIQPDSFFDNVKFYSIHDGVPEGHVFSGHPLEAVELFLKAMPGNFREGLKEVVAETRMKVTCLLTDAFFWFAADMAEEMGGVPWVALWTAGPLSLSVHLYTDLIRSRLIDNAKDETRHETLDFVPGMSAIHIKDLPDEILQGVEAPFPRMVYNMGLTLHKLTAIALNSFEEIDPTIVEDLRSRLKTVVLNVGPFNLASPPPFSDENGCIDWLNQHEPRSVVYLSFGTILTPPPDELIALAETLESHNVPFLWSFRDDTKSHLILGRTSKLGKVVCWTPQLQVLEHPSVGVFVTHCGWNSVLESITGGVPMICRPFFADQRLNHRLVEDVWQIGVSVGGGVFTKDTTAEALDHVLASEEGRKMRGKIGVLKEKAKKAVGAGGSSSEDFQTLLKVVATGKNI